VYAFIHIPKTGGSTLRHMLRTGYGARHCDIRPPKRIHKNPEKMLEAEDLRRLRFAYPRLAGICGHRVTACHGLENATPGLRFFTLLREPRSRFLSHFSHWVRDRDLAGSREHFLRFCDEPIQANLQSRMLGGGSDPQASIDAIERLGIFVGLMERFDASVVMLDGWLGESSRLPNAYRSRNIGKKKSGLLLDAELEALIAERNASDQAVYTHVKQTVFAAQMEAHEARYGSLPLAVRDMRSRMENWPETSEPTWAKLKRNWIYKPMRSLRAV